MATPMEAALEYAGRGWPIFPVHYAVAKGKCSCGKPDCSNPAKHPMTRQGLKDASKDPKQIKEWWDKHPQANIGIATGQDSGLVVVDIDPRHGGLDSMKAISKLGGMPMMTPTVATGGGGEHIYLAYPNNGTRIKNTVCLAGYQGVDLRGDGGYVIAPPSRHISGGRYTWKVRHLGKSPAKMPEWFIELTKRRPGAVAISSEIASMSLDKNTVCLEGGVNISLTPYQEGSRDNTLFTLAKTLRKGGMSPEEVAYHVAIIAQKVCDPPMSPKVALEKVSSTFQIERNISAELKEFIRLTKGLFSLIECYSELNIVTPKEKGLIRVNIHKLVEANILEKLENRPGLYRVVETGMERIELTDDEDEVALDLKWPCGLENLVDIMPKNIVIVAGSKDAGKSAFCLNTVKMNMHKWDIHYFSSEMGQHELKRRLRRFDDLRISEWKFNPWLRASKFADVIFPEAFNIIDYLEISKDFSLIAEEIKAIYDKLTTGIALIAIQKDPKAPLGRGSSFSLEKARMYVTLDRDQYSNVLTIVSGKNWHQESYNPAGIKIKYKLINGARFIEYE